MSKTSEAKHIHRGLTKQEVASLITDINPSRNLKIVNFDLKPFSSKILGYLGVHELLTVEASDGDTENTQTYTFFVKSVISSRNDFDYRIFREEKNYFDKLGPQLLGKDACNHWSAKCYLVRDDLFILENLRSQNYEVSSHILTERQLRAAITTIAQFHAASMVLEKKLQKPLNEVYPTFLKQKIFIKEGFAWKWLKTGIEVVEALVEKLGFDPKYASIAYNMVIDGIASTTDRKQVICHCDLWTNNLMFKDNEDGTVSCKLIDFQLLTYNCYAYDIVQFLHLTANKAMRDNLEKELIELYHSVLEKRLRQAGLEERKIIKLDTVFRDVKNMRITGLVLAVQYFPIALLNNDLAFEFTHDIKKFEQYMYVSRKDFTHRAMTLDEKYRIRVEECMKELMEFMKNL